MKRINLCVRAVCTAVFCILTASSVFAAPKKVQIGTVTDGPGEFLLQVRDGIQKEVLALLNGEFDVSFPKDKQIVADWDFEKIFSSFNELQADPEIDVIITIGGASNAYACSVENLQKPVVAPMIMELQEGVPFDKGTSGRKNLSYLSHPWGLEQDLKVLYDIYPFKKLAFLNSKYAFQLEDQLPKEKRFESYLAKHHSGDFVLLPIGESAEEAVNAIPDDVDAVYLFGTWQMDYAEFEKFIDGLNKRKLPSFTAMGHFAVEQGVLGALRSKDSIMRMPRQVAVNIHRILLGEDAGKIPVNFATGTRLLINAKTAHSIDLSIPFRILIEAETIEEDVKVGARRLTYKQVIEEALASNLDLAVAHHDVLVGQHDEKIAVTNMLPGFSVGTQAAVIDKDRAEAAMGGAPQFDWTASATLTQVLSEGAFANHAIQGRLQNARRKKEDEIRLDIIEAALLSYLNVLRAQLHERILKNNVGLSRTNLDLTHKRIAIGVSSSAEKYRWESVIANQRQDVVNAVHKRQLAELELNRLLRKPLEEEFVLEEVGLESVIFGLVRARMFEMMDNPKSMQVFRDFAVQDALRQSPELAQLGESEAAIKREMASIKRSYWVPSVGLTGQVNQRLFEAGEGTDPPVGSPEQDDTNWNVGLSLSWPMFEGGQRIAKLRKLAAELIRLETQKDNIKQRIEQRVRVALKSGASSAVNIHLSRQAASAAGENLKLVTEGYSRGVLTVLDLLDAQNASLTADIKALDSEFMLMIHMINAQRAGGGYFALGTEAEIEVWAKRVEEYLKEHNALPPERVGRGLSWSPVTEPTN
ncbi:MAG: TolC family protein [Proteobacteria bacterium]|nr:TolC family protein [Pseudomonadota bacterium]